MAPLVREPNPNAKNVIPTGSTLAAGPTYLVELFLGRVRGLRIEAVARHQPAGGGGARARRRLRLRGLDRAAVERAPGPLPTLPQASLGELLQMGAELSFHRGCQSRFRNSR
jgi:hypothetical protein